MDKHKPKVLISGSAGYFGQICSNYFTSKGWEVIKATRHSNADIFFDLDEPDKFAMNKINLPIDLFIHAAGAHEVTCLNEPYKAVSQNVLGTKAALDFCVLNKIKKFVYLSTFHVYGNPKGLINETTPALPLNDYGLSHLQAEEYVNMYTRKNLIKGTVLRPTNFFGVPTDLQQCQRWTLVPLAFCKDAIEKEEIILKTPGYQLRNFISITDICKVIEYAYFSKEFYPLLHIPGPETLSIRSFAEMVQRVLENELNKNIQVDIPKGINNSQSFHYKSLYLSHLSQPSEYLEPFIKDLCQKIIKEGGQK